METSNNAPGWLCLPQLLVCAGAFFFLLPFSLSFKARKAQLTDEFRLKDAEGQDLKMQHLNFAQCLDDGAGDSRGGCYRWRYRKSLAKSTVEITYALNHSEEIEENRNKLKTKRRSSSAILN